MRTASFFVLALSLLAGCRRAGPDMIDPNNPDLLAPCPDSEPHLAVGLRPLSTESEQALLRFTTDFEQCQGTIVSSSIYGTIATVGGLPDGTDLVGFTMPYGDGGTIVGFDGMAERGTIEADGASPLSIAALTFEGVSAFVVVWGDSTSSSAYGDLLEVYSADFELLGSWDTPSDIGRASAPVSGQGNRIAAWDAGNGLQEFRSDPGATALATTGELRVAQPGSIYGGSSLDVLGSNVRATASQQGVLYWRSGLAPAFLGPVYCRYAATRGGLLPDEDAYYIEALVDREAPDENSLVLIEGAFEGASTTTSQLYVLGHRGDCADLFSIPTTHLAIGIAWAGDR